MRGEPGVEARGVGELVDAGGVDGDGGHAGSMGEAEVKCKGV